MRAHGIFKEMKTAPDEFAGPNELKLFSLRRRHTLGNQAMALLSGSCLHVLRARAFLRSLLIVDVPNITFVKGYCLEL